MKYSLLPMQCKMQILLVTIFACAICIIAGCDIQSGASIGTSQPNDTNCENRSDANNNNIPTTDIPGIHVTNPLRAYQWYYANTGQTTFSRDGGTTGKDLGLTSAHKKATGKNVKIMVVDDGLDMDHEDLRTQYTHSLNVQGCNDPSPTHKDDFHGTAVAGLINMQDNSYGGVGVAPGSILLGYNLLSNDANLQDQGNRLYYAHGLSETPNSQSIGINTIAAVFNNSWGASSCSPSAFNATVYGYYKQAAKGRENKGHLYVISAGNGFSSVQDSSGACDCSDAKQHGVSCENSASSPLSLVNIPQFIVVGASNADGEISSYSSHGANLWISAPGGEHGLQGNRGIASGLRTVQAPAWYYKPAMVTTDIMGCAMGRSRDEKDRITATATDFDYPLDSRQPHPENAQCNYMATMNGTSSSAPITSGVVALLLEVNPNFTWRDIKHILVKSTDKNSADNSSSAVAAINDETITVNNTEVIIRDGWVENNAGYKFSNTYGFGIINADTAIEFAKKYPPNTWLALTSESKSNGQETPIPIANARGATSSIELTKQHIVEHVRIEINATHTDVNNLHIRIISPAGTQSIVYWPKNAFQNTQARFIDFALSSNAFYGEQAKGRWKLHVIDVGSSMPSTSSPSFTWTIEVHGRQT